MSLKVLARACAAGTRSSGRHTARAPVSQRLLGAVCLSVCPAVVMEAEALARPAAPSGSSQPLAAGAAALTGSRGPLGPGFLRVVDEQGQWHLSMGERAPPG